MKNHLNRSGLKPLDLNTAYNQAWNFQVFNDSAKAVELDSELKDLIHGLVEIAKNQKQIQRFGTMHATSKKSIVTKGEDLELAA